MNREDRLPKDRLRAFVGGALIGCFLSLVPFVVVRPKTALGVFTIVGAVSLIFGLVAVITPESRFERLAVRLMAIFHL
jgi:hypothetical protein